MKEVTKLARVEKGADGSLSYLMVCGFKMKECTTDDLDTVESFELMAAEINALLQSERAKWEKERDQHWSEIMMSLPWTKGELERAKKRAQEVAKGFVFVDASARAREDHK